MAPRRPIHRVKSRVGHSPLQRLAALGALAADGSALVLGLVLILTQPAFALVVVLVGIAFVASSIAALVRAGLKRTVLAAAAVTLLITELALVVSWGASRDVGAWFGPVILLLLAVGLALGRYALRVQAPAAAEAPLVAPPVRRRSWHRAVLFVNPRSGGGKAEEFGLIDLARDLGVEVVILEQGDDLQSLARRAAGDGADVLGMAGGDGSQACVLGVAAEHDIPFVCIPSGTRNHFALDLGLDRRDPRLAFAAFTEGEGHRIDYATVNDRVFVNNVALGIYALIVDQEGYREAKLQTTLDLLPQIIDAGGPWFDLDFDVPEEGHHTSATLLLVSNNPYDIGAGSVQRQRLDRGELGIIALNPETMRDLLSVTLLTAAGRPDTARSLLRWESCELTVGSPHPEVVAGVDGETVRLEPPLRFAVVQGGAQVLLPPGALIGLDEQRAGTGARFAGLLEVALDLPAGDS